MLRCLSFLTAAVVSYKIHPVAFGIIVKDFFSFSERERRFMTGAALRRDGKLMSTGCPKRPYFVPFTSCMQRVASHAAVGGKAHFYFGLDRHFAAAALLLFRHIKGRTTIKWRERIGEISFPLAKETPQLQAADLLSYLTYIYMTEWTQNEVPTSTQLLLSPLVERRLEKDDMAYLNRDGLAQMLAIIPECRAML